MKQAQNKGPKKLEVLKPKSTSKTLITTVKTQKMKDLAKNQAKTVEVYSDRATCILSSPKR